MNRKLYPCFDSGIRTLITAILCGVLIMSSVSVSAEESAVTGNPTLQQQNINVTIKVLEEDNVTPIVGAAVLLVGDNSKVAISDVNGVALLKNVPANGSVTISLMGMNTETLMIDSRTEITATLVTKSFGIGEVVVVGFGTQKKQNLTGAVSQVSMDKILGDRPITSISAALQGAIPGLVISGGSAPGASKSFNIRGTTSINGGGPLVLVDNVPAQIDLINPEDVESVTVLKDAASAAIYGARAAFGVILITTKKAKANTRLQLNYNNNFAFETAINRPLQASVLDILQTHLDYDDDGKYFSQSQDLAKWVDYVKDYNDGTLMSKYPNAYLKDGRFVPEGENIYYYLSDNDPTAEIIDKFGFQQTHNISATGGSDKITYRISMGYTDNDGVLITNKDKYSRINVSSYVGAEITSWLKTALDIRYAKGNRSNVERDGNVYNTYFRRFYPTGKMPDSKNLDGPEYLVGTPANYMLNSEPVRYIDENPRIYSRSVFTPIKGFEGVFEYTYDGNTWDKKSYSNNFRIINDQMGVINSSDTPTYRNDKRNTNYNSMNAYATYNLSTKDQKHNFKIMGGYSQEQRYSETLWANRIDIINPEMPSLTGSTGETKAGDAFTDYTIRSGFFRFNYNFQEKYMLETNGRYDGSSKFPKSNRFGFFPSASIGWQIAKENFMESSKSWLNELKLRASWGEIGNQAIDNYLYTPSMDAFLADWIVGGKRPTSLGMPALVRDDFTWEVVETLDIGADISMLNNRLQATFDWYRRDTKGMLMPGMELPAVVGASAPQQNAADLRTKGWELTLQWRDVIGAWGYNVGFNIYDSKSKITKYDNAAGLFYAENSAQTDSRYREGMQLGEIWGYVTDGYYTIDDFKDGWNAGVWQLKDEVTKIRGNNNIRPGDVKFKNMTDTETSVNEISEGGNTVDNPGDQIIIGNSASRYQYGVNAGVSWKGFNLSLFLNGTGKRDAWLSGDLIWPLSYGTFGTVYYNQLDYWKPVDKAAGNWTAQNPDAYYPRLYNQANASGSNYRRQTKYLSDASYVRLKNVTVSYSVPVQYLKPIGLHGAKVFFSAENIYTWSKLPKGYDPERLNWGYPFYATYSFGINITL